MKLAIIDFDGTLLTKDTLPCLAGEWMRQGRSKSRLTFIMLSILPIILLYKVKLISRETMKSQAFKRFNRLYTNLTRPQIEEFFRQAYPFLKPLFNRAVLEEIKLAQREGFRCILLSGSYIELLQIISQDLGLEMAIGAKLAYKGDLYDHKGVTPFVDGMSKRQLLLAAFADENVDWEASRAYGDSYTDIYIMETVGEKVAVNPDAHLLAYAQKNGWRVLT